MLAAQLVFFFYILAVLALTILIEVKFAHSPRCVLRHGSSLFSLMGIKKTSIVCRSLFGKVRMWQKTCGIISSDTTFSF